MVMRIKTSSKGIYLYFVEATFFENGNNTKAMFRPSERESENFL